MTATNDMNATESTIAVRYENQREQIERLLAMPDEYPTNVRSKYIREVYGSGACLDQTKSGEYFITVRV